MNPESDGGRWRTLGFIRKQVSAFCRHPQIYITTKKARARACCARGHYYTYIYEPHLAHAARALASAARTIGQYKHEEPRARGASGT